MDYILDILIPRKDMGKLSLEEVFFDWGGKKFSRNPKEYRYKSSLFFKEHINEKYYEKIIRKELENEYFIALTLQGETLIDLTYMINCGDDYEKNDIELVKLIEELYNVLDAFYIILLLEEEEVNERHMIDNAEYATVIFLQSFNRESPKGIVISKV